MLGFLLLDKPEGIGSFDCIRRLRKAFDERRIGFAGTLDPLATGLLIVAVGEATKLLLYLEGMDKVYEVTARLGAVSDTYDLEGEITELDVSAGRRGDSAGSGELVRADIEKVLEEGFLGERDQVPPMFSAVHVDGKRAYERARGGEKVALQPRQVKFYDIVLRSYSWPRARLKVHCSKGTYIRSFIHDLGQKLGCGAYVEALRRTKVGPFSIKNAQKLAEVEAAAQQAVHSATKSSLLVPPQSLFTQWSQLELTTEQYRRLAQGQFLPKKRFTSLGNAGPIIALFQGQCVGILEQRGEDLKFAKRFII